MSESIDLQMRRAIVAGELPPSSKLQMEQLKARFNVGFSPIREALSRLLGEGLVELEPNRGFRVAGLTRDDLEDIATTRIAIETAALKRSIARRNDEWEVGIIGALHRYRLATGGQFSDPEQMRRWEEAHDALHASFIANCGSPRLITMQRRLQEQQLRYRRLAVHPGVSERADVQEHENLVATILKGDAEEAVAEIARHLMLTLDLLDLEGFWERYGQ